MAAKEGDRVNLLGSESTCSVARPWDSALDPFLGIPENVSEDLLGARASEKQIRHMVLAYMHQMEVEGSI